MKKTNIILSIIGVIFILTGLVYIENYIIVAIFWIFGGLLIIPTVVDKLIRKVKNKKIQRKYIYIMGVTLIIIGSFLIPKQFVITNAEPEELISKARYKKGYIQYYGIKSVSVSLVPYKEMEIVDYIKNKNTYSELFNYLMVSKTYEDNSVLYKNKDNTLSILICGTQTKEKDIIIGTNNLIYKENFCGSNKAPEEKKYQSHERKNKKYNLKNKKNYKISKKTNIKENNNYRNIKKLNNKQKENFIASLKECNMNPSKVKNLKKEKDWNNGTRYSFMYKGDTLWLYIYDDNTISSINLSLTGLHIYDEKYESLDYENYYISADNKNLMKIKAEEQIGIYLKDEARAKYDWNGYQRTNEYFSIFGTVKSKNSFNQKVKSTVYVEFKLDDNKMNIIYVEINEKNMYGAKVVPQVERAEKKNIDTSSKTSIILKDGVLGIYGKYDNMDNKQYIRYYIPSGKYKVTALVRNSMFYIDSISIHKENGYDTPTTYNSITLKNKNDNQIIEITNEQCISLVIGTKIKLEKMES